MDRTTPPKITIPEKISIPTPETITFSNGNQLVVVNAGTQDVTKVEIIIEGGTCYQEQLLSARTTSALLAEGTTTRNSQQIAESLDFLGSFTETSTSNDYTSLSLLSINKHLDKSLEILSEMLYNPTFPEQELDIYLKNSKQSFIVEQEKVTTLARKAFTQTVYKNNHPYGHFAQASDFDKLQRNHLVKFHQHNHLAKKLFIVAAGKISSSEINLIEKYFNQPRQNIANSASIELPKISIDKPCKVFTPKADAVQNAIRIGKATISRNHPDFPSLLILNTILGGYFGSRLMSNIREDKGYTYGISSALIPYRQNCIWVINTQVGCEYTQNTVDEIYKEIERLKIEEVPAAELDLVKSHLTGEILRNFDGPFNIAESLANIYEYNNFNFDYFTRIIETIRSITSKQIVDTANKYFSSDGMVESIAGKLINN